MPQDCSFFPNFWWYCPYFPSEVNSDRRSFLIAGRRPELGFSQARKLARVERCSWVRFLLRKKKKDTPRICGKNSVKHFLFHCILRSVFCFPLATLSLDQFWSLKSNKFKRNPSWNNFPLSPAKTHSQRAQRSKKNSFSLERMKKNHSPTDEIFILAWKFQSLLKFSFLIENFNPGPCFSAVREGPGMKKPFLIENFIPYWKLDFFQYLTNFCAPFFKEIPSFFLWGDPLQNPRRTPAPEYCISSRKRRSFEVPGRGGIREGRGQREGEKKGKKDLQKVLRYCLSRLNFFNPGALWVFDIFGHLLPVLSVFRSGNLSNACPLPPLAKIWAPQPPELQQWTNLFLVQCGKGQWFFVIFLRPFSLDVEGRKICEKIRQNFTAIFADLLQNFRKNFALGDCGHNKDIRSLRHDNKIPQQ